MYDENRLKASEREAMMRQALAEDFILKNKIYLDARLAKIPRGRNLLSSIGGMIRSLNVKLYETIPVEQLQSFKRNIRSVGYTVGVMLPGEHEHNDQFGLWLSFDTINTLVSALKDHCLVCNKDPIEQRKCPLQKALDEVGNDLKDNGRDCKYRGVL